LIQEIQKWTHVTVEGINFAKDYQKNSYNIKKLMGKNQKDKKLLTTFKNIHTLKYVEFKTLKIQSTFQNWSRI